jgi:alkyl sulfatase BDS1-like metallo-beta-lactamase superfamily hydrolase
MASLDTLITQGAADQDAIALGDGIYMSRGIANCYLVQTVDGDVMINTGLHFEAPQTKARFDSVSKAPLRQIVFTQGHPDHVYGWSQFNAPGVETIAQRNHTDVRWYWRTLHPFYVRRIMKLWGAVVEDIDVSDLPPEPVLTTSFLDTHTLETGGRRFELYATPGGEATDALIVWLPASRTAFIGNLMGPMFGHVPNLYTVRGDKIRSVVAFIRGVERVMALKPETLINGHDVFRGAADIQKVLKKVRDATQYLMDETIKGMNAGKKLWTLMETIRLPNALSLPEMHGKVPWIVRAIWEEHTGWFRYESTTELYDVPPSAVWKDLVELAGPALLDRAKAYAENKRPLHALHLTDVLLSQTPETPIALKIRRDALQQILDESGGTNFSEVQWLKSEIALADAGLASSISN